MPAVLLVSPKMIDGELSQTVLFRHGVERYRARAFDEATMMALAARPELVLVDRDMPRCEDLVAQLRADATTRALSIAIVSRGEIETYEVGLMESGANAILRLPASSEWDKRLVKLMSVALRRDARFPVHLHVEDSLRERGDAVGLAHNLSSHGMLVEASVALHVHDRVAFAFRLREKDAEKVSGHGRVVRQAGDNLYGVEFEKLDHAGVARIQHFVATLPA
jgi:DNA-binding response OmpR family regulator